jgi:hypothetical protein
VCLQGGPIKEGASTQVETGHEDMIVGFLGGLEARLEADCRS